MNHVHSVMLVNPSTELAERKTQLKLALTIAMHIINPQIPVPAIIKYVETQFDKGITIEELVASLKEILSGDPND